MAGPWTLEELVAEVATALAQANLGQGSNRVRDTPDLRTARYYTTLGLLDGPSEFRGKVGLYLERQRLQLLAIKRLQAQGESLASIQARLLGLSTPRLRALAEPPDTARERIDASASAATPVAATALQAAALDDTVTVLLRARRALTPEDLEAIAAASAPLLRLLRARHLVD